MKKAFYIPTILAFLMISVHSNAQNLLNTPESVVFDTMSNHYFVSNYSNGTVVEIDENGVQSYFATGQGNCAGLHI
ncbi:MAG: hypothetical protein JSV44_02650, partial [Candidatus Zixiibacteriota bacterium]